MLMLLRKNVFPLNKGINETKAELLVLVKRDAVEELFGSYVKSLTKVKDFTLQQDSIETYSSGLIRIKGSPKYSNGENLGEICIQINAFVKKEDLEKMQPKKLSKKTCESGGDNKTIKKRTEEKARLEALLDYDLNFKQLPSSKILPFLREVTFSDNGFIPETSYYCTKATGFIYPIELASLQAEIKKPPVKEFISGLKGEYFNLRKFSGSPGDFPKSSFEKIDKTIDFEWGSNSPAPRISADYFGVKWTGIIYLPVEGTYLIKSYLYNGGIKLSIDNSSVIDSQGSCGGGCWMEADIYEESKKGKWYPIKIEFFHTLSSAKFKLYWRKPGDSSLEIIPSTHLRTEKITEKQETQSPFVAQ